MPAFLGHKMFANICWKNERMLWKSWTLSMHRYQGGKNRTKTYGGWVVIPGPRQTPHSGGSKVIFLYFFYVLLGLWKRKQRSSSRCRSHEISGIYLATVHFSSQAFRQCLGRAAWHWNVYGDHFVVHPGLGCPASSELSVSLLGQGGIC